MSKQEYEANMQINGKKFVLYGECDPSDCNEYGCNEPELVAIRHNRRVLNIRAGESFNDWIERALDFVEMCSGEKDLYHDDVTGLRSPLGKAVYGYF